MESTFNETDGLCVKSKDVQTLSSLTSKLSYWCDDQIQQAQQPTNTTSGLISVNNTNKRKKLQKMQCNRNTMKEQTTQLQND